MDRVKYRRRRSKKPKKVLLSIVDPWDVKVASVEPVSLASRRGVSLSTLITHDTSQEWSVSRSPGKVPSPWYKPCTKNSSSTSSNKNQESQSGSLISPEWPLPWYVPQRHDRTPVNGTFLDTVGSHLPVELSSVRNCKTKERNDVKKDLACFNGRANQNADSLNRKKFEKRNLKCELVNGEQVVQIHFEDEKRSEGRDETDKVEKKEASFASGIVGASYLETDNLKFLPETCKQLSIKSKEERSKPRLTWNYLSVNDSLKLVDNSSETKNIKFESDPDCTDRLKNHPKDDDESLVSIVEQLVRARYNPLSTTQRRLDRLSILNFHKKISQTDDETVTSTPNADVTLIFSEAQSIKNSVRSADTIEFQTPNIKKFNVSMLSQFNDVDGLRVKAQKSISSRSMKAESDSSATFSNSGSTPNESDLDSETEDDIEDNEFAKIPLHAPPRRKATIVPQSTSQKIGNDTIEIPSAQSTNSTITSVNSISSLLKEKLQLSIPQALWSNKKQQNANYRLRSFVGILFLCVVFLVGFAHVYYTKHVLQRAYFDKFRFNKNERVMHIYNNAGSEIIATRLGEGILPDSGVFSCLPHHQRGNSVCLEWVQQTRLYLAHTHHENMDCYHVTWQSLSPDFQPKDCFDWSSKRGHWYGAGQIQNMAYPLEQGKLDLSPFITGDIRKHPFGNVLKRYFLNSKGATIVVDPETPLYVSINANRTKDFCLQAKYDTFAYVNHPTPLPRLNYTICATDNIKSLHSSMAEKSLWDGLKPEELHAVHSLLSEPVWQISPTNEAAIYNYTEDVIALGFLRQGHVLLSEEWQPNPGDFVLDESRFPSMKETINIIHRRGFRIVFTVQPFISTESINFKDAVANKFLVSERGSDPRIPALTRYKQSNSAGVLDITNNKTLPWLQSNLESLMSKYHVDSFYLDLGTAQDIPHYYKCERPITNPDHYKTLFTKSVLGSVSVIGVSGAISRPRAPVFVSLPPFPSSWKAIKTVIPTVLTYGMIGYPFIMPGAVGGDVALPMSDNNPDNDFEVSLPDKELYVRWLQLSTFLPVIRFTHLPSKYSDESVLEMAKDLTTLRQKTVTPLLKKYANETLDSGLPIIRPLWMLDPADPACHVVVDEFSVGEELIVAPILYSGSRQREVYLPAGVWRDGIDGSLRKGSRWIHNYRVAEDKVAYFVKMPDNTRF